MCVALHSHVAHEKRGKNERTMQKIYKNYILRLLLLMLSKTDFFYAFRYFYEPISLSLTVKSHALIYNTTT